MHSFAKMLGKAAMVVKEARIDENAECQVRIVARKSGFWAWLMSVLGIDSTFTLEVYRDRIESEEGSLCGRIKSVLPLSALDTYTSGYTKPFAYLVIGVILAVEGLVGCFASKGSSGAISMGVLLAGIGCLAVYALLKTLMLSFTTIGANGIYFLFKRSIIEGVPVDENFAVTVCEIVKANYLKQVART